VTVICDILILWAVGFEAFNFNLILANIIFAILVLGIKTNVVSDFATKMFLKSDKINLNSKALQTFTKEAVSTVDDMTTSTIPYSKLYKVMETDKYIFYYLNKMQAGIVVKANNTAEEIEFISSTLKENVKKYIVYNK
ncbi:MAG: YcxB family protein, partial [Clostridia bacterium]|nr:YcxB family protein [Clostridia bacterium]